MQFGNEPSGTASRWTLYRSYDAIIYNVIAGHKNIYVNNSSQKRGRTVDEVSLCLSCQDASTDLEYDLPGSFIRSGHLTWSIQIDLLELRRICFDTSRREECDGFAIFPLSLYFLSNFLIQKLFAETLILPKNIFVVWPALGMSKCDLR